MRRISIRVGLVKINGERGIALVTAVMLVLAFAVLGGAAVIATTGDVRMSKNLEDSNQALSIAEAGANYAMVNLKANWGFFSIANPADTIDESRNFPNSADSNAKFELRVTAPTTNTRVINSTGIDSDAKRIIEVKVSRVPSAFNYVLLANMNMGFRGSRVNTNINTTGNVRVNRFTGSGAPSSELRVTWGSTSPAPIISFYQPTNTITYGQASDLVYSSGWTPPGVAGVSPPGHFAVSETNVYPPFISDYAYFNDHSNFTGKTHYYFYSKNLIGDEIPAEIRLHVDASGTTAYWGDLLPLLHTVYYEKNGANRQRLPLLGGLSLDQNSVISVDNRDEKGDPGQGWTRIYGQGTFTHSLVTEGTVYVQDKYILRPPLLPLIEISDILFKPGAFGLALAAPEIIVTTDSTGTSRSIRFGEASGGVLVLARDKFCVLPSARGGRIQVDLFGSILSFNSLGLGQDFQGQSDARPDGDNGVHIFNLTHNASYADNLPAPLYQAPEVPEDDEMRGWDKDYLKGLPDDFFATGFFEVRTIYWKDVR